MAKINEICNLVAYITVRAYDGMNFSGSYHGRTSIISIECLTTSGEIIEKKINGLNVDETVRQFIEEHFHCDKYFFTGKVCKASNKSSRYGSSNTDEYSFYLNTVLKI